jgi:DNA-binding MarR family transcriptional regulator
MAHRRRDVEPLLTQVVRLSRLLHRLKNTGPDGSYGRSGNVLLLVVDRLGPLRVADLATTCHVDASTVSRQAAELVREGLLRREADPGDGRSSLLALTPRGEEQVAAIIQRRREFFSDVVSDWTNAEVESFLTQLTRFVNDIERRVGSPADHLPSKVDA